METSNTKLNNVPEKSLHRMKILVMGDANTGKTSIIKRYITGNFQSSYKSTIIGNSDTKRIKWDEDEYIQLQLWDLAGMERTIPLARVFYKDAAGALIVCDVTTQKTFDLVKLWKTELDNKVSLPDGRKIPCILLLNKCDLVYALDKPCNSMEKFCEENGFFAWFRTSAKLALNIEDAVLTLVTRAMHNDKAISKNIRTLSLNNESSNDEASNKCAC